MSGIEATTHHNRARVNALNPSRGRRPTSRRSPRISSGSRPTCRRSSPACKTSGRRSFRDHQVPARPMSPSASPSTVKRTAATSRLSQFHPSYSYEDFVEGIPAYAHRRPSRLRAQPGPAAPDRGGCGGQPGRHLHSRHRRDQPGQRRQGARRALLPPGVPGRQSESAIQQRRVQPAQEPLGSLAP